MNTIEELRGYKLIPHAVDVASSDFESCMRCRYIGTFLDSVIHAAAADHSPLEFRKV